MWELILTILRWLFGGNKEDGFQQRESSGNLINLLSALEGSSNAVYADPIGLYTIGVGHLITTPDKKLLKVAGSDDVNWLRSNPLANSQVRALLELDLEEFQKFIRGFGWELVQHEEDALVSLVFNIGTGNFSKSTMKSLLDRGASKNSIAKQFAKWRLAGGRIMGGLQMRRAVEATVFLGLQTIPEELLKEIPQKYYTRADSMLGVYYGK